MGKTAVAPAEVGVQVGDFFSASWGYDQTNVDFYKVVGLTPKGVKVQPWTSAYVGGQSGGPVDHVVPGEGPKMVADTSAVTVEMDYWERQEATVWKPAPVMTKRLSGDEKYAGITISSYKWASKWDGKPEYVTGSGWGH